MLNLNPNEIPDREDKTLPAGEYVCSVVKVDNRENAVSAAGKNYSALEIRLQVLQGDAKDRLIFDTIRYEHENDQYAHRERIRLKNMFTAGEGEGQITESSLTSLSPVVAKVARRESDVYGPQNDVVAYKSYANSAPQATSW